MSQCSPYQLHMFTNDLFVADDNHSQADNVRRTDVRRGEQSDTQLRLECDSRLLTAN